LGRFAFYCKEDYLLHCSYYPKINDFNQLKWLHFMEILIKIWSDSVLFSSNFLHLKQLFVNKVTEQ